MPSFEGSKIRLRIPKRSDNHCAGPFAEIESFLRQDDALDDRPITVYALDLEGADRQFVVLIDTAHPEYGAVTLLVQQLAVPKVRGTRIEEYVLSEEKISWLGGSIKSLKDTIRAFFALCTPSVTRLAAFKHIIAVIGQYRYARMVLNRRGTAALASPSTDYSLESYDMETLRAVHANAELATAACFPSVPHGLDHSDVCRLPIASSKGAFVKQTCMQKLNIRLRCEYTFGTDADTRDVRDFTLRHAEALRPYQRAAIDAVFTGDHACSGLVVLPCGAGKTLTGISIASRIGKRLLILCVNTFSVYQWRDQILRWTNVSPKQISVITSSMRESPADIVITTYTMLTMDDTRRNDLSRELISAMLLEPFGLVLLDEVHMAAARNFRRAVEVVKGHCFIGLTATLLREDDRIADLDYLIGPLLYECSMYALKSAGSIADVNCAEVLCAFPEGYLLKHLQASSDLERRKLYNMNPTKIWCCQALLHYHEKRADKTLVFVDSIAMLELCARLFKRPMIHGETNDFERECILSWFKNSASVNTIFISRIGDSALDIPETNVIIQLSSLFGSQRTEVQRIGRIQRLKASKKKADFYSLVTPNTREVGFSTKRKQFLLSEGYGYTILEATDITRHIFGNGGETADRIRPVCIGRPAWGFQPATEAPIALSVSDSIAVERALRWGSPSVKVHDFVHELPHTKENGLPGLEGPLRVGPFVQLPVHDAVCGRECLEGFASYILSEEKDFIEFTAGREAPEAVSPGQSRPKTVDRATKAATQSSAFKRRDKEIHRFRMKLLERNAAK